MALIDPVHCFIDVKAGQLAGTERRYKKTFADLEGFMPTANHSGKWLLRAVPAWFMK